MKHIFAILALIMLPYCALAQELNAKVVINTAQIGNTNTEACETFKEKVQEFLNTKQWTSVKYNEVERIECTFNITINKYSAQEGAFECTLLLNSSRPV